MSNLKKSIIPIFQNKVSAVIFLLVFLCFQNRDIYANISQKQNILIVIAHPNPESFNHAIMDVVQKNLEEKGHLVRIRDLYELQFQPILTLQELKNYESQHEAVSEDVYLEQQAILWANHIIFIYPTWWWSPPAILKGYFDRIFTPVFAFDVDVEKIKGKLSGKKVTILQTTGSDEEFIIENELDSAVKKIMGLGIFDFIGMEVVHHEFIPGISSKTYPELKGVLEEVDALIESLF